MITREILNLIIIIKHRFLSLINNKAFQIKKKENAQKIKFKLVKILNKIKIIN